MGNNFQLARPPRFKIGDLVWIVWGENGCKSHCYPLQVCITGIECNNPYFYEDDGLLYFDYTETYTCYPIILNNKPSKEEDKIVVSETNVYSSPDEMLEEFKNNFDCNKFIN